MDFAAVYFCLSQWNTFTGIWIFIVIQILLIAFTNDYYLQRESSTLFFIQNFREIGRMAVVYNIRSLYGLYKAIIRP